MESPLKLCIACAYIYSSYIPNVYMYLAVVVVYRDALCLLYIYIYTEGTNFTSGKMQLSFSPETSPDRAPHQPSPGSSVYRLSYRPPQGVSSFDRSLPTTRFGSTQNRAAAVGVGKSVGRMGVCRTLFRWMFVKTLSVCVCVCVQGL